MELEATTACAVREGGTESFTEVQRGYVELHFVTTFADCEVQYLAGDIRQRKEC